MDNIKRLKKRSEFLTVRNKGGYVSSPYFIIQFYQNSQSQFIRLGYTATKKIGNAVFRNRCKRRLKALSYDFFKNTQKEHSGFDFVFIAKKDLKDENFCILEKEFLKLFSIINHKKKYNQKNDST